MPVRDGHCPTRRSPDWHGLVWLASAALAACTSQTPASPIAPFGLHHDSGSAFVEGRVHYGIPILQKSFFWDGNGETDDSGLGLHAGRYFADGIALGAGANLATWWTGGRDVYSCEIEGLLRGHPIRDWPVFVDGTAGYQLANDQIPPGGTVWNFTFGFGGGLEFPVGHDTALLAAVYYHHISNALGRENERNPSQNEARIWLGFEWTF